MRRPADGETSHDVGVSVSEEERGCIMPLGIFNSHDVGNKQTTA